MFNLKSYYIFFAGFFFAEPLRSARLLFLMVAQSLTSGVGILLIIPLLTAAGIDLQQNSSGVTVWVTQFWELFGTKPGLVQVLLMYLVVVALIGALNYVSTVSIQAMQQSFMVKLRVRLFTALVNSEWPFSSAATQSDYLLLLTEQMENISYSISKGWQLLGNLILIATYIVLSLLLSVPLTFFAVMCGLILFFLSSLFNRSLNRAGDRQYRTEKKLYSTVSEGLSNLQLLKAFVQEDNYRDRYEGHSRLLERDDLKVTRISALSNAFMLLGSAATFSVLFFLALTYELVPVSHLIMLLFIFSRLMPQVNSILTAIQQLVYVAPVFEALIEVEAQLSEHQEELQTAAPLIFQEQIRLNDVGYYYPESESPTLSNVNLTLAKGQTLYIQGPSGVGKSTLADILAALRYPDSGQLLIDDRPLQKSQQRAWRRQVAYVTQTVYLLNSSVRSNLVLSREAITDERLWEVLGWVGVAKLVRESRDGLDTIVGERGILLSGGERQRLALARALLGRPQLLILDEATNALDLESVQEIMGMLREVEQKMTLVVIAHQDLNESGESGESGKGDEFGSASELHYSFVDHL